MSTEDIQRQIELILERQAKIQGHMDSVISELRSRFDKLILSDQITRDLANKIASLEVQTNKRITELKQRDSDTESEA